ncbi:MAG: hypothetical protein V7749_00775 [Cocleimonas sp.]
MIVNTNSPFDMRFIDYSTMIFALILAGDTDVFDNVLITKYGLMRAKDLSFRQIYQFVLENISTNNIGELTLTKQAINEQHSDLIEALEFLMDFSRKH